MNKNINIMKNNVAKLKDDQKMLLLYFYYCLNHFRAEVESLVEEILRNIPKHSLGQSGEYTMEQFKAEGHIRTMHKDGERICQSYWEAKEKEKRLLNQYFDSLTYDDPVKCTVKAYMHWKLSNGPLQNVKLARGGHPFEDVERTMWTLEDIFATEVLHNLNLVEAGSSNKGYNGAYCYALINQGIKSASWNRVYVLKDENLKPNPMGKLKLKVISEYLTSVPVSSRMELVLARSIGGQRFMAVYELYQALYPNESEEELFKRLKKLSF